MAGGEASESRVALVIGNANYRYGKPLRNPHQDAEALAGMLQRLGFELTRSRNAPERGWHADLDLISMRRLVADFGVAADGADMAAVYFAGHGLEVDGENYLLPVDAELDHVRRVRAEASALKEILADIAGVKKLPLVILDACRDNPFVERMRGLETARSFRSGLADIEPSGDVLVAYAARQGAKAQDGPAGGNSPFALALLEHLETPDVDIRILLGRVRDSVRDATKRTGKVQFPHVYGSLGGEHVYLKHSRGPAPAAGDAPASLLALAAQEWARIEHIGDIARLKAFAKHFAGAYYAGLAEARIAELEAARVKAAVEARYRAEGRMEIAAAFPDNPHGRWFLPGAGKTESFKDAEFAPEMVVVPASKEPFWMGSPSAEIDKLCKEYKGLEEYFRWEGPQTKVTIRHPFAIGRYAVTRGEFAAFVKETGHTVPDEAYTYEGGKWELRKGCSFRNPGFAQDGSHPVVCVNWEDATAYTKWLSGKTGKNYRLPSEAEWEYACRAGTDTPFWWGASISADQANYNGNHTFGGGKKGEWRQKTVPVRSFQSNPWGLYQVHGNVWEWCEDCWNESHAGARSDGSAITTGDCSRRVLRGGSWDDDPPILRSANRIGDGADYRYYGYGFRLARTLIS